MGGSPSVSRPTAVVRSPGEEEEAVPAANPRPKRFSQAAEEEVRKRGLLSGVNAALEQANVPMSPGEPSSPCSVSPQSVASSWPSSAPRWSGSSHSVCYSCCRDADEICRQPRAESSKSNCRTP